MARTLAVLIDGGHLRVHAKKAGHNYDPDFIEKVALKCAEPDDEIHRALYYDCAPYIGTTKLPVSGSQKQHQRSDPWLHELARKNLFAVRRGELKFRGYRLKRSSIPFKPTRPLTDSDFEPTFEQKGVDMRIGLDMAIFASNRSVSELALITNDTDCIPAMKHVRRAGLRIILVVVPN
ncbi:MAG: NYN domain-containing protein [Acidobacteria bacterium]|nr:NYN domain-containing protein [Acidobacteriota bacterium]